jgi:hypothetical protein
MKRTLGNSYEDGAVPPEPIREAEEKQEDSSSVTAAVEPATLPPEQEEREYIVKPGCAVEHAGIRYEGSENNTVIVVLSAADAEVHKSNLE